MSELSVMRSQTAEYIGFNPDSVVLTRNVYGPDGAGGRQLLSETPQAPQTMRIIQQREGEGTERRNADGEVVRPKLVMLAVHDANVEIGDTFTWREWTAEVVYVQDMETQGATYERVCEVALR